jgi:hypothetical protein
MKFNINNTVRVKLTTEGIKRLKENHNEVFKDYKGKYPFHLPEIDKDGYTEFQLWNLMSEFGQYIHMGGSLLFETEIDIPDHV